MKRALLLLHGALCVAMLAMLSVACSQIDCPLNNRVYATYQFYDSQGDSVTLADTMTVFTIRMDGEDSVLINQQTSTSSFALPLSYTQPEDQFFMTISGSGYSLTDTIWVRKEDTPHFESVDCNPAFFHTLSDVRCTHHAIDSIVISNKTVNYDSSKKHFHIHLRSSN